jgi:K+-sensing histidine kinase KdpD
MSYSHRVLSVSYAYNLPAKMPLMPKARRGPEHRLLIFGAKLHCAVGMRNQDYSVTVSKSDRIRTLTGLLSSYVVAAISVGIAVVITLKLGSVVKHTSTLFFCSVMLSSWYGGLWPGVFAALLSVVALDYYFIPPLMLWGLAWKKHRI